MILDYGTGRPKPDIRAILFLVAFAFLYLLLVLFVIVDGPADLSGHRVYSRVLCLVAPVYAAILLSMRPSCLTIDFVAPFVLLAAWFLTVEFLDRGKSGFNFFVLEPHIVGLVTGLYLLRFPLARILRGRISAKPIAILWLIVTTLVGLSIVYPIPPIPE